MRQKSIRNNFVHVTLVLIIIFLSKINEALLILKLVLKFKNNRVDDSSKIVCVFFFFGAVGTHVDKRNFG